MGFQKDINSKTVDVWLKQALSIEDPLEKLSCYTKALEINPINEKVWHKKSYVLYKLGRYEEAVYCCDKALGINSENETCWYNKGCALYGLGKYEEAIESYKRALRINPRNEKAWLDKGRALCKLGKYENAIECYDEVIKLNYKNEMGWYNKSCALYKLGRYEEAIKCFDNTIEINPKNKKAWHIKGRILEEMGKYEYAARWYKKAAEINPYDTAAWDYRKIALDKSRSKGAELGWYFEPIIKDADEALKINPIDDKAWIDKGNALVKLNRFEDAIDCYNKALEINQKNDKTWIDKGNALFKSNRFEDAIECYNKALKINQKNDKAWHDKGNAHFKLGSIDEAIKCYNKALEINPTNNILLKDLEIAESSNHDQIPKIIKSGFRVYLHLEPPPVKNDKVSGMWKLKYSIQSLNDSSLIVPVQKIGAFDDLKAKHHFDLMQASYLYPPIEESLRSSKPVEAKLTTHQAYLFLKDAASRLEEHGFGIKVPMWWDKIGETSQISVKFNLEPKNNTSEGICSIESIINYQWELTIGGKPISEEEFKRIAKLEEPLVFIRKRWIELKKEDVEKALKFFGSKHSEEISLAGAVRLSLGKESEWGLPIKGITSTEWISEVLERLSDKSRILELPQPSSFVGNLYTYQIRGFSWLAFLRKYGIGACLADDMGLGKTIQVLALLLKEKEDGVDKPTLLICPLSVVENWKEEAKKFSSSLNVVKHHEIKHKTKEEIISDVEKCDLLISTYDLVRKDEDVFIQFEWNGVILDEAQKIKNPNSQQSKVVKRFKANFKVALTGTPIENRLKDMWSIMDFLNPGYLWSENYFHMNFELPIRQYKDKKVEAHLREIIRPFILRRRKTDPEISKDLPEKYERKVHCNLTLEQAELYKRVVKDMLRKIEESDGIERKGRVFSALTHLKQVCDHPALLKYSFIWDELPGNDNEKLIEFLEQNFGIEWVKAAIIEKMKDGKTIRISSGKNYLALILDYEKAIVNLNIDDGRTYEFSVKLENGKLKLYLKGPEFSEKSYKLIRLREMLEEVLDNGECALVFTQFVGMGEMLKTHFQEVFGKEVLFYHGGLSKEKRDSVVKQFELQSGPPILILSLKACLGLNLTRANHVFHFDRWWNPAVENQATDRAYRRGQTKNVMVHKFVCDGTIEERIDEMIEAKKGLAEDIIGTEDDWFTEITTNMTTEQLRELFALRGEAILDE